MTNKLSSFPSSPAIGPLHRHGGKITAMSELPIHPGGDDYTVEGNGTIRSLPTGPVGISAVLRILGTPTFANSTKLICQGGVDYPAVPGDLVIARSDGDGVWRVYVLATSQRENWPFPQGRLTLTSGTPVMTASVAGATTVYYTAAVGKNVPIYNGIRIGVYQLAAAGTIGPCELPLVLGANWATNSNYDFFLTLSGGLPVLATGPAWTSDSARGTGAGTTELIQFDGLYTNKVSITARINNTTTITVPANQGTYVGSMRTGSAGQTNFILGSAASGGVAAVFGLWNAYNRVLTGSSVVDNGATYTYTSGTKRQARASGGNQASFMVGIAGDAVMYTYAQGVQLVNAISAQVNTNVGFNSATTYATKQNSVAFNTAAAADNWNLTVSGQWSVPLGWNTLYALEGGDGTNANIFDFSSVATLDTVFSN